MLFLACFCLKVQPSETFDPEFEDINPFLNGSQLTPKAASERMLNMLKRIERLEGRLVSHLRLVKEYVSYHKMSGDQQNFVVPSWDDQAEFFDLSDQTFGLKNLNDAYNAPVSNMNANPLNSMKFASSNLTNPGMSYTNNEEAQEKRFPNSQAEGNGIIEDERRLNEVPNKNFVDFLREAQTPKPQELTQQSLPLDHPMLHNYGTISQEDLGFNELKAPSVSTPSEAVANETSNENKDGEKAAIQSSP